MVVMSLQLGPQETSISAFCYLMREGGRDRRREGGKKRGEGENGKGSSKEE